MKKPTSAIRKHDHYANQIKQPGTTSGTAKQPPKPSPTAPTSAGVPTSPKSKRPRQAEEAVSPDTDTSNGGL